MLFNSESLTLPFNELSTTFYRDPVEKTVFRDVKAYLDRLAHLDLLVQPDLKDLWDPW